MRTTSRRVGLALGSVAALAVATALPASAFTEPVSIRAELDIPTSGAGPRVFVADAVVVGDGPELTPDDQTENPSGWCGDVVVDLDPDAQTIDVTVGDQVCDFTSAEVRITTDEITAIEVLSDEFADLENTGTPLPVEATLDADGILLRWVSEPGSYFYVSGTTTLSYELAAAEEPVEEEPVEEEPETDEDEGDEEPGTAAPATPVVADPNFAG